MKRNPQITEFQKLQIAACVAIDTGDDYIQFLGGRDGGVRGITSIKNGGGRAYHPYEKSKQGFLNYGSGDGKQTIYRLDGTVARTCYNKNFVDDSGYIEGEYE